MKRTPALVAGFCLVLVAGGASAQWRTTLGHGEPTSRGYPTMHEQHEQPTYRNAGAPSTHGPPPPVTRGPPAPISQRLPRRRLGRPAGRRPRRRAAEALSCRSARRSSRSAAAVPATSWTPVSSSGKAAPAYRVRWAEPDGQRIDYMVDAETGAILGVDEGH